MRDEPEKERAETTLHSIADAVIRTDADDRIEYMNPVAEQLTGWSLATARGKGVDAVLRLSRPEGDRDQATLDEWRLERRDGREFFVKISRAALTAAVPADSAPGGEGQVIVFHDVTEYRNMARLLAYRASHDGLTGLINRRTFERAVRQALHDARRGGQTHYLFYIDLDQFKIVNDSCGHKAGDALLQQIAAIIPQCLRDQDAVARLGGDEFGVLIRGCDTGEAMQAAERIRSRLAESRFAWQERLFEITVSIGMVGIGADSESLEEVLSNADIACYAAKEMGRNRVHFYHTSDQEMHRRRSEMDWIGHLTRALEEDRLVLYYQAIEPVDPACPAPPHGEILVRMRDEQGELVPPGQFLPAAERYNLMPSVDQWIIRHTFAWLRDQLAAHSGPVPQATLCINLSGTTLSGEHFLAELERLIGDYGIPPRLLCFEITETAVVSSMTRATLLINRLRELGCRFALDDFGSGLSSFGYLKNLNVDFLKIDGTFVRDLVDDPVDFEMVRAIHQVGKVTGIRTIAEFVENDAIRQRLADIGVDLAQGFGVARPIPLDQVQWDACWPGASLEDRAAGGESRIIPFPEH